MQTNEIWVRIESKLTDDSLQVARLDGHETISQLFEFEALVVLPGASDLDPEEIVSSEVALIFEQRDPSTEHEGKHVEVCRRHGFVTECCDRMLDEEFRAYRLRIVPRYWRASLVETLDIFMGMSIPDIIRKKLDMLQFAEGTDYEFRLQGQYEAREFIVQFKETDLDFIGRLTEHWGICYFFEHRGGRDVLVFADHNAGFYPAGDDGHAPMSQRGERRGIFTLEQTIRAVPRMFVQRDYNYRSPGGDLTASTEMPDGYGGGIIEYGGHFKTESEGKYFAQVRAEEHRARRWLYEGASQLAPLAAGTKLTVEGHKRGDIGLVLTSVRHRARQTTLLDSLGELEPYHNDFDAIPEQVAFRPARRTPKPKVNGVLTGIVDAAQKGEYAELDDEGRYKIKFMFDTSAAGEGKASRSVRMMQPHTGAGYGMHFPLRPGIEVLITFVDGNPDRPIIAGTVPNPQTASPVVAGNATKNVIRTGGGNEIDIDDEDGKQRIKLSCPTSNTVFQLGSPNAPELGAFLTTSGSFANVTQLGTASATSIGSTIQGIASFGTSNVIKTVAEEPGPWEIFCFWGDLVKNFASILGSGIEDVQNFVNVVSETVDSIAKIQGLAIAHAEENANAAKRLLGERKPANPPTATVYEKNADGTIKKDVSGNPIVLTDTYKNADGTPMTVLDKYEADRAALQELYDKLAEARTEKQAATQSGMFETANLKQKEIDALEEELNKAKHALADSSAQAKEYLKNATPADVATAYTNYITTYEAYVAAKDVDIANKKVTDEIIWWCNEGWVGSIVGMIKNGYDALFKLVDIVYTAIVTLGNTIKWLTEAVNEDGQWAAAGINYDAIGPRTERYATNYGFGIEFEGKKRVAVSKHGPRYSNVPRHTVGSQGFMKVFGDKRVLVHSPMVVISGATNLDTKAAAKKIVNQAIRLRKGKAHADGSVVVVAEANAMVMAKKRAELNGMEQTLVTSQKQVLLKARKQPHKGAPPLVMPVAENTIKEEARLRLRESGLLTATATKLVMATAHKKLYLRVAKKSAGKKRAETACRILMRDSGKMGLKAQDTVAVHGKKKVTLDADKKAQLLMDAADQKLEAKGGDWALTLSGTDGVSLGKGSRQLGIDDDGIAMCYSFSDSFSIDAQGAQLTTSKLTIDSRSGNCEVKANGRVLLG